MKKIINLFNESIDSNKKYLYLNHYITFFKFNHKIKSSLFLIIIFMILIPNNHNTRKRLNKICLCTVAKEENIYIREFIEYYKNYGIDKIFIYDNNDKNGEKFEDVINVFYIIKDSKNAIESN